jgi:hypothetical protein
MSDAEAVESRLRAVMESWHLPIEPDCERHLLQLIHKAALRVEADGFASDPPKLLEAETNFIKLLTEMTRQAGAQSLNALHESILSEALHLLCPIWPFCVERYG